MIITRENYEAFFLDYLEGNLDAVLLPEFNRFLEENLDLKEELLLVGDFSLPTPTLTFDRKTMLYKGREFLYWNLLPGYGIRKYNKPEVRAWKGLSSAGTLPRLIPPTIVCDFKQNLKQEVAGAKVVPLKRAFYYSAAAAAIAALLWMNLGDQGSQNATVAFEYAPKVKSLPVSNDTGTSVSEDPAFENAVIQPRRVVPAVPNSNLENDFAHTIESKNEETPQVENELPILENIIVENEQEYAEVGNSSNEIVPHSNPYDGAVIQTNAAKTKSYSSIWDLAQDKAKSRIWGDENYPTEKFGVALASRELSAISKPLDERKIIIKKIDTPEGKRLHIKIGKFEHTRKI